MTAQRNILQIAVKGTLFHLNVSGLSRIAALKIAMWVGQSRSDSNYIQIDTIFRDDMAKNLSEAESWVRTIRLAVNDMVWKAAVAKKFKEVAVRWMFAMNVVCKAIINLPLDAVRKSRKLPWFEYSVSYGSTVAWKPAWNGFRAKSRLELIKPRRVAAECCTSRISHFKDHSA